MRSLCAALLLSFAAAVHAATGQATGRPVEADLSPRVVKSTGSTTARALKDRFADVVNVKDFGAKGDGVTDDRAAIQSALNAVAPGGVVFIPAGTYRMTATATVPSSVTLRGAGAATVLRRADATATYAIVANADYLTNTVGASSIAIEDIAFDSNGAGQGYAEARHAVVLVGARNVSVTGCRFLNLSGDGIYISSTIDATQRANYARDIRIIGNHFEEANLGRNAVSIVDAKGVTITGNTFRGIASAAMPGAIDLEPNFASQRVLDVTITGNTFDNCRQGVQAINTVSATARGLVITGNVIRGTSGTGNGIYVVAFTNVVIEGNAIFDSVSMGIYASGCSVLVILGNGVYSASSIGIWVSGGTSPLVEGNTIYFASNDGIRVTNATGASVLSNQVRQWGSAFSAVRFDASTDALVKDNHFDGESRPGVTAILSVNASTGLRGLMSNMIRATATAYSLVGENDIGTAAPVAGTWRTGERRTYYPPTVGQPKGWVCTSGGTPGTWVSEGNL